MYKVVKINSNVRKIVKVFDAFNSANKWVMKNIRSGMTFSIVDMDEDKELMNIKRL